MMESQECVNLDISFFFICFFNVCRCEVMCFSEATTFQIQTKVKQMQCISICCIFCIQRGDGAQERPLTVDTSVYYVRVAYTLTQLFAEYHFRY
uniref:Secreted protein n=1 Tax=Arundo donax TaxID=35708 RepID=A0A0A9GKD8_ARUDO